MSVDLACAQARIRYLGTTRAKGLLPAQEAAIVDSLHELVE